MKAFVTTLGDICEFRYGKPLPSESRRGGQVAVYGSNGVVGYHDEPLVSGAAIVVGRKGSFGEVHYADGDSWPIDTTYYIDKTATNADLKWLTHALRASRIKDLNKSAAVPGLNRNDAYRLPIVLPPLDEQRRIAAILDKADALRQKRKRAIALLDTVTQSIFLQMFGDPLYGADRWPTATIGEVVERIESGWSPVCLDRPANDGEWGVLKLSAITSGTFLASEQKALPESLTPRRGLEVREGDVLFTRKNTRALVAATALVGPVRPGLMLSDLVFRLVPRNGVRPAFLATMLSYPSLRKSIQSLVGGSAGSMPNISKEKLRAVVVPVPPKQAQQKFASAISKHLAVQGHYNTMAAQTDTIFASLQHRAFSGQL